MFVDIGEKIVNLKNVSNINVLENRNRIVFNTNYSVQIFDGQDKKLISDYIYWDFPSLEEMEDGFKNLFNSDYFIENFVDGTPGLTYINKHSISSLKFEDYKYRAIFNLSHNISFRTNKREDFKVTSEFVYVNFKSKDELSNYKKYVLETLSPVTA